MSPRVLAYSFRVWLTGVLLGPALVIVSGTLYIYLAVEGVSSNQGAAQSQQLDWPKLHEVLLFYLYGFVMSIPGFFLFWIGSFYVCHRSWPIRVRKLALSGLALVVTVIALVILNMIEPVPWQAWILLGAGYFVPMLGGILFYRFPIPVVTEFEFD